METVTGILPGDTHGAPTTAGDSEARHLIDSTINFDSFEEEVVYVTFIMCGVENLESTPHYSLVLVREKRHGKW